MFPVGGKGGHINLYGNGMYTTFVFVYLHSKMTIEQHKTN